MIRFSVRFFLPALLLIVSLLHAPFACAQTVPARRPVPGGTRPKQHLHLKAFNYGDSIVLRWGVDEGAHWLAANRRGYVLERLEYTDRKAQPVRTRLTAAPIRPWSLDSMKKRLGRNDRYAAIAAQLLHGKLNTPPTGNSPAGFYQRYQQQQGQWLMAAMAAEFSAGAASALALRWADRTFNRKADRTVYRLWINNGPAPKPGDLRDTATVMVLPWKVDSLAAPKVATVDAGDSVLTLRWYRYHNSGDFSGFFIERSNDGKTFKRLNEIPYVDAKPDTATIRNGLGTNAREVTYTDSVRVNYRKFYYRIIGINSFGDQSPASKLLVGSGRDLTPPRAPVDVQKQVVDNRRIILTWTLPKPSPDLKGFYVGQANDIGGPYQPLTTDLLPASARTFVNERPVPYFGRYYVIAAVDTAGNTAFSPPVAALIDDKVPPAAPRKPTAQVDTSGVVTLRWPANVERDVLGYKVYRAYTRDDPYYQQRTTDILADSVFTDTLPSGTLTKQAFYQLVAVDLSNNHSLFSEPLAVAIPDRIPPSTPIIRSAIVQDRGIVLQLIPSLSDDVTEHVLYRREPGTDWQAIKRIAGHPVADQTWLDTALVNQHQYEYSLMARDAGGRWSDRSFIVSANYVNLAKLAAQPPASVQARYDIARKSVRLDWQSSALAAERQFVIYRCRVGESLIPYRLVGAGTSFVDASLPGPGTYTYAVQTIVATHRSALSKSVQASVQP
ncbi:hypothetical protein CLV58_10330 [Spirosoma oryzae]|uniref:Fibronectin type 3 domain-containing protein n=1 Tax=Spirosoma oryzae TaxID=1469603 RepID=A0A2T0TEI2_9BACT|nr:hypothetical protein [Spirosoma oryzae]PRY44061.1 hypothetical protein CLV58_10330 [Spirosoma oryzae]